MEEAWEIQLKQLQGELILFKESIRETAMEILKEKFSEFPIFIAHQEEVKIGEVILSKEDMATTWSISASTFEEFQERNLIPKEKAPLFKSTFKSPKEFICLFVVYKGDARFVFVPYQPVQEQ